MKAQKIIFFFRASSCESGETTVKGKRKKDTQSGGKTKKLKLDVNSEPNILDSTSVHPESYALANKWVCDNVFFTKIEIFKIVHRAFFGLTNSDSAQTEPN